ncbi:LysR family transcriptional regulator [Enterococcus sp. AZ109]|uniref:LysR family transcriptional regulator n=1 Tax=Enterococcus sp. AZ109 TaxID=2774634 RepID=UPI003F2148B2
MDPNIQKYMTLLKVIEKNSFSKAGKELNYSQASISRMLKDLELNYGFALLIRRNDGVELTPESVRLLPYITDLVDAFIKLQEETMNLID